MLDIKAKTKISATISSYLAQLLECETQNKKISRSAIIEDALRLWVEKKLARDAKATAKMKFNDLPTEDEWIKIQSKWWENE